MIATVDGRSQTVARIGLTRPETPHALRKSGDGLYDIPEAERRPVDPMSLNTRVVQGALEQASVKPITEIANLANLQRAYERMQRIVSDDDDRLRRMIETLSRNS
jgi:flagellar basal-body rod protein FlgF